MSADLSTALQALRSPEAERQMEALWSKVKWCGTRLSNLFNSRPNVGPQDAGPQAPCRLLALPQAIIAHHLSGFASAREALNLKATCKALNGAININTLTGQLQLKQVMWDHQQRHLFSGKGGCSSKCSVCSGSVQVLPPSCF
jgi:hypothetical protein